MRKILIYLILLLVLFAALNKRSQLIELLEEKGIDFEELKEVTNQPKADPFDVICHIAFMLNREVLTAYLPTILSPKNM